MPDSSYDGSPQERLFERTGWLQAQIADIRATMLTKADLLEFAAEMDRRAQERDERRGGKIQEELDRAFKMGVPGTMELVREEIEKIQRQDQEQHERELARAGLEYKDDGSIGPKVHPVRRALVRNGQFVAFGLAVAAAANPEQAINLVRLGLQFAL